MKNKKLLLSRFPAMRDKGCIRFKDRTEDVIVEFVGEDEDFLCVDLFTKVNTAYRLAARFFFGRDDWTAYMPLSAGFRKPCIYAKFFQGAYGYRCVSSFASPKVHKSLKSLMDRIGATNGRGYHLLNQDVGGVLRFIQRRYDNMARKLRFSDEMQEIDALMRKVPSRRPKGLNCFVKETVFKSAYRAFRDTDVKRITCSHCGFLHTYKQKEISRKDGYKCPSCGFSYSYEKIRGYSLLWRREYARWFSFAQTIDSDTIVVRTFSVEGSVGATTDFKMVFEKPREVYRTFITQTEMRCFIWSHLFRTLYVDSQRWCPTKWEDKNSSAFYKDAANYPTEEMYYIYPDDMSDTWAGKIGLAAYVKELCGSVSNVEWGYERAYDWYKAVPLLFEQASKAGLGPLIDISSRPNGYIGCRLTSRVIDAPRYDAGQTELRKALCLDSVAFRLLTAVCKRKGDLSKRTEEAGRVLRLLQRAKTDPFVRELIKMAKDIDTLVYLALLQEHSYSFEQFSMQIMEYGLKPAPTIQYLRDNQISLTRYSDYLKWVYDLGCYLGTRILYPKDFNKAHDEYSEKYQREKTRIEKEKEDKYNAQLRALRQKGYPFDAAAREMGFLVRLPYDTEEIRNEGRMLHHCVGTYVPKVVDHRTSIWFVRKVDEPEKPFYTMEYWDGEVRQLYGDYDRQPTADVKTVSELFTKHMQGRQVYALTV